MALSSGTRLGPYEILSLLGRGGMGEVYRARDTKLNRDVAIKVLPDALVGDGERLARFEREAQTLAALHHPNIAAIYGVDESSGIQALVLELVEGPTLADRIDRGPIPIEETLPIARQIAEALEAAHDLAIVHRDLKPANIKLRPDGTVKVLDFGLAKAGAAGPPGTASVTASPTITSPAVTAAGVLLGTAAYMSPEQARGGVADKRSDVWAFGCVVYEMLAGHRAFAGDTLSDTLAAILRAEPDWNALPRDVPTALHLLLRRCLEKDRRRRIADVSTARFVLDAPEVIPASPQPRRRWRAVTAAAIAFLVVGGLFLAWNARPDGMPPRSVVKFAIPLPSDQRFGPSQMPLLTISADGEHIVYVANGHLNLRSMSDTAVRPIPGSEGSPLNPTFSPDGESIAYFVTTPNSEGADRLPRGSIKRIRRTGGTPVTVCDAVYPLGLSWGADGLVFGEAAKGVMRVSAEGGEPQVLVPVKPDEIAMAPQMLPGGRAVLFTYANHPENVARREEEPVYGAGDNAQIVVHSLENGSRKTLVDVGSDGRYLPSGHIVYAVGGTLRAVRFDVSRLEVSGPGTVVLEGIGRVRPRPGSFASSAQAQFAISANGSLVYISGPVSGTAPPRDVALYDRNGGRQLLNLPPMLYQGPRTSPNGQEIAVGTFDSANTNVWIYDTNGKGPPRQLTFQGRNRYPTWSADGLRITFQSDRDGDLAIYSQLADGSRPAERLFKPEPGIAYVPHAWSPKDEYLLFSAQSGSNFTLWTFAARDRTVARFGEDQSSTISPAAAFSPDGHWVAYQSGELPNHKLIVRSFPDAAAVYQVPGQAGNPRWSSDGRQLFFTKGPQILSTTITLQPKFAFGAPTPLVSDIPMGFSERAYDVAGDGSRFFGIIVARGYTPITAASIRQLDVVLNWGEELKRRVPLK